MRLFSFILKILLFFFALSIQLGELQMSDYYPGRRADRNALDRYVKIIAAFVLFILFLKLVQQLVTFFYKKRHKLRSGDNFLIGLENIFGILSFLAICMTLLSLFDVHIKEAFTSISIIFAGLAILTKDYVSNMISGMIITFSNHLSIGDQVKIGSHKGKIMDISLQNIHLLNDDDDYIYVPNNLVYNTDVLNYTKRQIKKTSIEFEVDLAHMDTVEALEAALIDSLEEYHPYINSDSFYLKVDSIYKDHLILKLQYILSEPNREMERNIRRTAIRRVVSIINENEK